MVQGIRPRIASTCTSSLETACKRESSPDNRFYRKLKEGEYHLDRGSQLTVTALVKCFCSFFV